MELEALDHVGLVVSDMARSIQWNSEVLGLRHVGFRTSRRGLEAAKAELDARGIEYHEGDYVVAWSVYLPDPDGYQVEITTYEPAT